MTTLHHCSRIGNLEMLKYVLDRVPDMRDVRSKNGETAALISAAHGDLQAIECLLAGPLRSSIISAMITDENGTSVLMACVARGDNDTALWLLKRFGKTLAMLSNKANMLPLHLAAAQGNIEFIRVVTKYDSHMVSFRDEFGSIPLVYAVQGGCLQSVRYLVEKARSGMGSVNNRGQSLLHVSCLCGHEHITRYLLHRMGSETILWQTKDNANAVHCAAFSGSVPVLMQLLSNYSRKRRQSVLALRDSRGNTPLHLAALNNHLDAALYLLENGSDARLQNSAGNSAQAVAQLRRFPQMAALIQEYMNGKKKRSKKSLSAADLTILPYNNVTNAKSNTSLSPGGMTSLSSTQPVEETSRAFSPLASSGYSSAAENVAGQGADSIINSEAQIVRRRMRYVEDGIDSLKDKEAQTDLDPLKDKVKVIDDSLWTGLGLSAVEHIDRVLDEAEGHSHPSPLPSS
ncbi:hypothetical protein WR25_20419 isoform B [Diploscapter pachys]|uniref:Uncharacterized protein n=1 Tax=Diploscapter pachys TaxID=2018661 RepID=A0A2A2JLQ5_9BILA|nr:hypothetical protein WR25_20419 isoform A [Diploscapter pachys]PAV62691.1 hypothetical protein WR25_20419 isoform B [Diploscapter pachys]